MRPYGYVKIGKCKKWEKGREDVAAIQDAGRKSSIGKFPEKCGKYKSYTRNTAARKARRRYFKRIERSYSFDNSESN